MFDPQVVYLTLQADLYLCCTCGSCDEAHMSFIHIRDAVRPVLSGHSQIGKIKVLKTNGSLMKVESIAECSLGAFCNNFDVHYAVISLENQF